MSLKGTNTQDTAIEDWRSKLLYLPPEVSFTEEENVEEFLRHPFTFQRYKNFVPNFDPRRYITDLTARVSLLSSGQKQRLALLRALSLNFEVLLLDESLSHMDGETRQEMLCLLSDVRKRGKIILLVTHFDLSITDSLKEFHL
jgi:ABC-type multidrug transport system ATPase subunit